MHPNATISQITNPRHFITSVPRSGRTGANAPSDYISAKQYPPKQASTQGFQRSFSNSSLRHVFGPRPGAHPRAPNTFFTAVAARPATLGKRNGLLGSVVLLFFPEVEIKTWNRKSLMPDTNRVAHHEKG